MEVYAVGFFALLICSVATPYLSEWLLEGMRTQNTTRMGMLVLSFGGWWPWIPHAWWVEPGTAPFRFAVFALLIGMVGVFVRLRARRKGYGSS